MNKAGIVGLVVLAVGYCGVASAEKPAVDKNQKAASAEERAAARFAAIDTDGNGTISLAEYKAMDEKNTEAMKKKLGDRYDADKAAKRPSAEDRFAKLDANKDGVLSREEFAARAKRTEAAGAGQRTRERAKKGAESTQ